MIKTVIHYPTNNFREGWNRFTPLTDKPYLRLHTSQQVTYHAIQQEENIMQPQLSV